MALSASTRDKLQTVSVATICTALFKRGFRNQFIQGVTPLNANTKPMVGESGPRFDGAGSSLGCRMPR